MTSEELWALWNIHIRENFLSTDTPVSGHHRDVRTLGKRGSGRNQ